MRDDMAGATMPVRAIMPWFGSKRTLAPDIVAELGPHRAYWEPFCGGLSVLLAKPVSSHETVNDLNGDLVNLARVLADDDLAPALYGRLSRVLFDERRRDDSIEALGRPGLSAVDRAFHWFAAGWIGRNGFAGTVGDSAKSFAVRWSPSSSGGGERFRSATESIPAWHHRLRRVTILNRDGFEVMEKIDDVDGVAIYCDPPYVEKSAEYRHDFDPADHARLAGILRRFKRARVVVSYYDHPLVRSLYDGWTFVDRTANKGLHSAGRRGQTGAAAPELLVVNGAPACLDMFA